MKNAKSIGLALLVLLAIVIAVQNREAVETRLLFVTVTMPRALLLLLTFLVGIVAGLLAGTRLGRRKSAEA